MASEENKNIIKIINSKAAEETEEEYDENDYEVNLEVKKAVRDIKERYQIKETIDNLELLKATIEKNEDYSEEGFEKIIAETNEDVIVEFCIKEAYNNMININNLAEELNKCIMSDTEEIPNDIEYIAYSNGDFEATKTVTNEFGTKSIVKIYDIFHLICVNLFVQYYFNIFLVILVSIGVEDVLLVNIRPDFYL